jgi:hypothetical protein
MASPVSSPAPPVAAATTHSAAASTAMNPPKCRGPQAPQPRRSDKASVAPARRSLVRVGTTGTRLASLTVHPGGSLRGRAARRVRSLAVWRKMSMSRRFSCVPPVACPPAHNVAV